MPVRRRQSLRRTVPVAVGLAVLGLLTAACGERGAGDAGRRENTEERTLTEGLEVRTVRTGYPAERAGVEEGDRIVGAGDLTAADLDPARWLLFEVEVGSRGPVPIHLVREGRTIELELPVAPWGLTIAPTLPEALRSRLDRLDEATGELADDPAVAEEVAALPPISRAWWRLAEARATTIPEDRHRLLDAATEAITGSPDPDPVAEAWVWWRRSLVEHRHGERSAAANSVERALERLGDRPLAAGAARIRLGIEHFTSDQRRAQQEFERAVERIRSVSPASTHLAVALGLVAQCQANRNELDAARDGFERALAILETLDPDHPETAQAHYQLGRVARADGDLAAAGRWFESAVERFEAAGLTTRDAGTALMGMGSLASVRGDLTAADDRYRRAKAIYEAEAPGTPHHIWSLRAVADIAARRGRLATAERTLEDALALALEIGDGDSLTTGEVLWGLAEVAEARDRPGQAIEHLERALEIFERRLPESSTTVNLQTELARMAIDDGRWDRARRALDASMARWREIGSGNLWAAWTRYQLGRWHLGQGDPGAALAPLRQAHETFHRRLPGTLAEADIQHRIARALRDLGRTEEALDAFFRAIESLEHQLPRLGAPESRTRARAEHREIYDDAIDLLIEADRLDEAFHLIERSRARALSAMLAERDLVFRSALPEALDEERRRARAAVEQALQRAERLSETASANEVESAVEALRVAREEQDRVRQQIRQQSPRLAGLSDPQPLTRQEAAAALEPDTVALVYQVGAERSWVFALDGRGVLGVEPLSAGESFPATSLGRAALTEEVERYRLLVQTPSSGPHERIADRLSRALLAPVASRISEAGRILIVPDGPLYLVPFAALPAPVAPTARTDSPRRPLVAAVPIHLAPSITLLGQLAALPTRLAGSEGRDLVAFGDPALDPQGTPAARRTAVEGLAPLPAARREVESIAGLFDRAVAYVGPEATETRVKDLDPGPRFLHFATHSLLDERLPLESALVLAPGEPESGGEDGLLRAWEIFEDLRLDADLVTLSACESALGVELAGEGLIGLSRAFHYAGARSVLASGWPVSDRSTAELMRVLYEGLRAGLPKDEALRQAQLHLLEHPLPPESAGWWARLTGRADAEEGAMDASHPFHWAAFQLYGDWR